VTTRLTAQALEDIADLPVLIYARVLHIVERLAMWPAVSGVKPLSGPLAGHYRIRTGDYRVQFRIEVGTIVVEKVGHRDRFYEG